MTSLVFIVFGLFLIYQSIGAYNLVSWLPQIMISKFHANIYCATVSSAVCSLGWVVGIAGVGLGICYMLEKKGIINTSEKMKGRGSYFGILVTMIIFSVFTIL